MFASVIRKLWILQIRRESVIVIDDEEMDWFFNLIKEI